MQIAMPRWICSVSGLLGLSLSPFGFFTTGGGSLVRAHDATLRLCLDRPRAVRLQAGAVCGPTSDSTTATG
jgi:hypothetical protein